MEDIEAQVEDVRICDPMQELAARVTRLEVYVDNMAKALVQVIAVVESAAEAAQGRSIIVPGRDRGK